MADKYIRNDAGSLKEEEALVESAGAGDSGKIPALDNTGRLDDSFMPVGIGADTAVITASEGLSAGDYVNVWERDDTEGSFAVRKADASVAGKEAHGYVLAAVIEDDPATVYFEGPNTQVTGQTPGQVFLSTTPGVGSSTAPSGSGQVVQKLGVAVAETVVNFEAQQQIVLVT